MKHNLKVGDRVRIVHEWPTSYSDRNGDDVHDGQVGTLDAIYPPGMFPYLVQPDGCHYHISCHEVEPVKKRYPVVVITTDGKTTTAIRRLGKEIIDKAEAVCNDADEFDQAEGERIAFERLQGRDPFPEKKDETPKLFSGKVVCVKSFVSPWWKAGKIYEIRNGKAYDDQCTPVTGVGSVSDLNVKLRGIAHFIPFVEG